MASKKLRFSESLYRNAAAGSVQDRRTSQSNAKNYCNVLTRPLAVSFKERVHYHNLFQLCLRLIGNIVSYSMHLVRNYLMSASAT